jgi:hypothetical protein
MPPKGRRHILGASTDAIRDVPVRIRTVRSLTWLKTTPSDRLITPSKVTARLDCPHYLTLRNQVDDGLLADPGQPFGSFARLLADKGLAHDNDCLADYRRQRKSTLEVPARKHRERFSAWVARIGNPLDGEWDVVYQMPFVHDGVRGIADFLVRVTDPETGRVASERVDAKLARVGAKRGHVL